MAYVETHPFISDLTDEVAPLAKLQPAAVELLEFLEHRISLLEITEEGHVMPTSSKKTMISILVQWLDRLSCPAMVAVAVVMAFPKLVGSNNSPRYSLAVVFGASREAKDWWDAFGCRSAAVGVPLGTNKPGPPINQPNCGALSAKPELAMLKIDAPHELLILERALLDLRFRPGPPNAPDISRDLVLAHIHRRILDARIKLETDVAKSIKLADVREWRNDDYYRPCVERMIRACNVWSTLPSEHRWEFVRAFVSPFVATDTQIADLVSYGDEYHGP